MADSALQTSVTNIKAIGTLLQAGHKAGDSIQSLRDGQLKSLGGKINALADDILAQGDIKVAMLGIGAVGNSATGAAQFVAPVACEIVGIRVASSAAITNDPLLTVDKKPIGSSAVNLLGATNYDMSGLTTAKQSADLTLTSTAADKLLAAGEVATALVTCDSDDAISDAAVMVYYKHTA